MKKALIIGISGQDGSYLAEYLLSLDYEVHGVVRKVAIEDSSNRLFRISKIVDDIKLHPADIEDYSSIFRIFNQVKPDECYHLAAESFVSYSLEDQTSTINTNILGTHNILSALNETSPNCKFYFAGSSEMFGKVTESPQNEKTTFNPRSIYGITKVAGFHLMNNYRDKKHLFACCGLLFNHESPRRGFEFVTRKISSSIAKIKLGLLDEIRLGNIDSKRDWGFSGDYVKAMHKMLQKENPDDYVISTNSLYSVKDFLEVGFKEVDLNYEDYIIIDDKYFRPSEEIPLMGDFSKANEELGWSPVINFHELVQMMVRHDLKFFSHKV